MAGLLGGLPCALWLSPAELDRSVRSIAHLLPGNRRLVHAWSRRIAGAATHMVISEVFAVAYTCALRPRLRAPSTAVAAFYGAALWAVNYRVLAPRALRAEDHSLALADHLCWGLVLETTLRSVAVPQEPAV